MNQDPTLKYNIKPANINYRHLRIINGNYVKVYAYTMKHRHECMKLIHKLSTDSNIAVLHVLGELIPDKKYEQEIKRGYYDSEKAKKYFS